MLIRRSEGVKGDGERATVADPFLERYPAIREFITSSQWPDGAKRERGTFTLFFEGGRWKSWVNDKAQDRSACVSAGSLADLLDYIEQGLVSDDLDWRRSPPKGGRR
jgi:hypothetical protein